MSEKLSVWATCVATLSISSFAGLAALLRSDKQIRLRHVASAMMNSGIIGLIVGLSWYQMFDGEEHVLFMLCISALAGLGGTSLLDFLLTVAQGKGLNISISMRGNNDEPTDTRGNGSKPSDTSDSP